MPMDCDCENVMDLKAYCQILLHLTRELGRTVKEFGLEQGAKILMN